MTKACMHGFPGKVYMDELRILLRKQIKSDASQISLFDFLGSSYCGSVPGGEAAFLYISIVL